MDGQFGRKILFINDATSFESLLPVIMNDTSGSQARDAT